MHQPDPLLLSLCLLIPIIIFFVPLALCSSRSSSALYQSNAVGCTIDWRALLPCAADVGWRDGEDRVDVGGVEADFDEPRGGHSPASEGLTLELTDLLVDGLGGDAGSGCSRISEEVNVVSYSLRSSTPRSCPARTPLSCTHTHLLARLTVCTNSHCNRFNLFNPLPIPAKRCTSSSPN